MSVKLAFLIVSFVIAVVSGDSPPPPTTSSTPSPSTPSPSQPEGCEIKGETDPCDSTDIEFLKKVCNKTAFLLGYLKSADCSLTFTGQNPSCSSKKIEIQGKQGAQQIDSRLLSCGATEHSFWLGKGESQNGVYKYSCEDTTCYPVAHGDVPDVFKGKNQLA